MNTWSALRVSAFEGASPFGFERFMQFLSRFVSLRSEWRFHPLFRYLSLWKLGIMKFITRLSITLMSIQLAHLVTPII